MQATEVPSVFSQPLELGLLTKPQVLPVQGVPSQFGQLFPSPIQIPVSTIQTLQVAAPGPEVVYPQPIVPTIASQPQFTVPTYAQQPPELLQFGPPIPPAGFVYLQGASSESALQPQFTYIQQPFQQAGYAAPAVTSQKTVRTAYEVGYPPYTAIMTDIQYRVGQTLVLVVLIGLLIISVVLLIWWIYDYVAKPKPGPTPTPFPVPVPPVDQDPGASDTGTANFHNGEGLTSNTCLAPNASWNANAQTCSCVAPFFGRGCGREAHDGDYYGLGAVTPGGGIIYTKVDQPGVTTLSFTAQGGYDPNSCTGRCDQVDSCFGVEYDGKRCALITSNPELQPGAQVVYNPDIEPDVYLYRQGVRPTATDRVFGYIGKRPLRFWAARVDAPLMGTTEATAAPAGHTQPEGVLGASASQPDVATFWKGEVIKAWTAPERVTNDGGLVGVWSLVPFSASDYPSLVNESFANVYVDRLVPGRGSDYPLNLPDRFRSSVLYVMYDSNVSGPSTTPLFFN